MEMAKKNGPLVGLKILDLSRVLSGPYSTMWCAMMGADVIKVENPNDIDCTHTYWPFMNEKSTYYPSVNHNKKGVTLNLKAEEGKALFRDLVKTVDVLVENYRPGVMDKLGLGYDVLKEINPRLVYVSVSGYGTYGPYKNRPGYDTIAQAVGGLMHLTGDPDGPPTRAGVCVGDTIAGLTATIAILAGVFHQRETGQGVRAETSLVDALVAVSLVENNRYFASGIVPQRMGNIYKLWTPYGTYKAKDGYYNIGVGTDKQFQFFAPAIGHPELATDPKFIRDVERVQNRDELDNIINEWASTKTVKEIIDILVKADVPCGPVNSIADLEVDEHVAGARNMFPILEQPGVGAWKVTNIPLRFTETDIEPPKPAPELGQHNAEIYGALGRTPEELQRLHEMGVI